MSVSLGTKGGNGRELHIDKKKFRANFDEINWPSRKKAKAEDKRKTKECTAGYCDNRCPHHDKAD